MGSSIPNVSKLIRQPLAFGLDTGLAALYGFVVIAAAARTLSVESVGVLSFIIVIVTLQIPLATVGLDKLVYARVSRQKKYHISKTNYLSTAVFISGIVFYCTGLISFFIIGGASYAIAYMLGGLRLLGAFSEIIRAGFRAERRPEAYIGARIASTTVSFLILVLIFQWPTLYGFTLVWALDGLLFAAFTMLQHKSVQLTKFNYKATRKMLYRGLPSMVQMIFVSIYYRFDQLYIGSALGEAALGVYAVGARVAEAGNMLFGLVSLMITPSIVKSIGNKQFAVTIRRHLFPFLALVFVFLIASYLLAAPLFNIIFGETYDLSVQVFYIYIWAVPFTALGFAGSAVAISCGAYRAPVVSGACAALVCVGLTVILTKYFGILGAAFATVASYAVAAGIVWIGALGGIGNMEQHQVRMKNECSDERSK